MSNKLGNYTRKLTEWQEFPMIAKRPKTMKKLIIYLRALRWELEEKKQRIGMFVRSRIRLAYSRLWIRTYEFDASLDTDAEYLLTSTPEEWGRYSRDLVRRRNIAHRRTCP